ncbi:hypothetical protein ACS0TY_030276 [Phlomoides rotata]
MDDCDNEFLGADFSEEKIRNAIWACDSNKSPGPDEHTFVFYKEFWESLKPEIMNVGVVHNVEDSALSQAVAYTLHEEKKLKP